MILDYLFNIRLSFTFFNNQAKINHPIHEKKCKKHTRTLVGQSLSSSLSAKETIKQISIRRHKLGIELHKNFNRAKNTHQKLARIELGTF